MPISSTFPGVGCNPVVPNDGTQLPPSRASLKTQLSTSCSVLVLGIPAWATQTMDDVESQSFILNETSDERVFKFDRWLNILLSEGGSIPEGPSGYASL